MNIALRKAWYNRADVMGNIIACIREREVSFMVPYSLRQESGNYPVRCIKAHHSSYLLNNMRAFSFFDRKYNLYHSIFKLSGMPMFSYKPMERREQQNDFFKKYYDYVRGVDFVMDFDGDKSLPLHDRVDRARIQVLKACSLLDQFHVPYCVMFSGSKGFHVEVRDFSPTENWNKRTVIFEQVASRLVLYANGEDPQLATKGVSEDDLRERLKDRYSFDSSIYNVTRLWKAPYSYDVSSDMIVAPLDDAELKNFVLDDYRAENMIKKTLWGVGLKKRSGTENGFWELARYLGVET